MRTPLSRSQLTWFFEKTHQLSNQMSKVALYNDDYLCDPILCDICEEIHTLRLHHDYNNQHYYDGGNCGDSHLFGGRV